MGNDFSSFCKSVIFQQFGEKTWQRLEFLEKIFGFQYLSLKLSLTLPQKGKMLWCSYYRSFIKSINLDRCGNFIKKFNFVSTPLKIIIPIAHHPPYHQLNTPSPTPPPNLPPPSTTFLTSTPLTPPPPYHHPSTTSPSPTPPTPPHRLPIR